MKTFNKLTLISALTVGMAIVACSEKSSTKKKEDKAAVNGVTEFITEHVDLTPPQKTSNQADLSAEEMNEAKEIYLLMTENNARLYNYIPFKNDSVATQKQKEKKLSQASAELKNLVKTIQENCTPLSADLDHKGGKVQSSISGTNCPIDEKTQLISQEKPINADEQNRQSNRSTGPYSTNEYLKYNTEEAVAVTKVKALKSSSEGTTKTDSLPGNRRTSYSSSTGKMEIVSADNKSILVILKMERSTSDNKENETIDSKTEAKTNLSTNKTAIITVLEKKINGVTISKKVYVNGNEILSESESNSTKN